MTLPSEQSANLWYRYSTGAILLHWAMALFIIFQIAVGFWVSSALDSADQATRFAAFEQAQIHKSVGLTVLLLTLVRIGWRIAHPAPPLPSGMGLLERIVAHASHLTFYGIMLALPLTGWAMVSLSPNFSSTPTLYFGGPEIPHLPHPGSLGADVKKDLAGWLHSGHEALAFGTVGLLILHVAAALKHHIAERDTVLARMLPGVRPRSGPLQAAVYRKALSSPRTLGLSAFAICITFAGFLLWYSGSASSPKEVASAPDLSLSTQARATQWTVHYADSAIIFSGANAGVRFEGRFGRWQALIRFDSDNLNESEVVVVIDVGSAATGDDLYDGAILEEDWFAAQRFPKATFRATEFVRGETGGHYVARGFLDLRGVERPLELPFTLEVVGSTAAMTATAPVNRLDFGIGEAVDPRGEWVSPEIELTITLHAEVAQGAVN